MLGKEDEGVVGKRIRGLGAKIRTNVLRVVAERQDIVFDRG